MLGGGEGRTGSRRRTVPTAYTHPLKGGLTVLSRICHFQCHVRPISDFFQNTWRLSAVVIMVATGMHQRSDGALQRFHKLPVSLKAFTMCYNVDWLLAREFTWVAKDAVRLRRRAAGDASGGGLAARAGEDSGEVKSAWQWAGRKEEGCRLASDVDPSKSLKLEWLNFGWRCVTGVYRQLMAAGGVSGWAEANGSPRARSVGRWASMIGCIVNGKRKHARGLGARGRENRAAGWGRAASPGLRESSYQPYCPQARRAWR